MIQTKKELEFYIKADYMMNRGYYKPSFIQRIKQLISPDYVMDFLTTMRKVDYYMHNGGGIILSLYRFKFNRLSLKLGFSISPDVFGYGLMIPHYGTIVVGPSNIIGNYAVIHTSTCITSRKKTIGDNFYLSTGAKVTTGDDLGNNIMVAANSVVTKGCKEGNALLVGMPASVHKKIPAWYEYQGGHTIDKVTAVENLKSKMDI